MTPRNCCPRNTEKVCAIKVQLDFDSQDLFVLVEHHNRPSRKKTPEELRELWKFAGKQIIMLMRMEKENARLQKRQNEQDIRRMKLEYDDILPIAERQLHEMWDDLMNQPIEPLCTDSRLREAIKSGVPRAKRGEVWMMLAKQNSQNHPSSDSTSFPNFDTPYLELLKNLTEHQHAIFMDIGRTFPYHNYYKAPFGMGQLSLFNILKAYSILDPELGYCQGLAFICGVLLLHVIIRLVYGHDSFMQI